MDCFYKKEMDEKDLKLIKEAYPNACVGVLYSTDSGNRSVIEWYDSELNPIGTAFYPFSGASVSQTNAHVQNDTVFLTPVGEEQKKDYGRLCHNKWLIFDEK